MWHVRLDFYAYPWVYLPGLSRDGITLDPCGSEGLISLPLPSGSEIDHSPSAQASFRKTDFTGLGHRLSGR